MEYIAVRREITKLLKSYGMDYREIDFEDEVHLFVQHMMYGLDGKSDLKMIPTYIDPSSSFEYNVPVIAIDAGGTNLRRAVITILEDRVVIEDFEVYPMPGIEKEISKEEFFDCIVEYIEPILHKSEKIGFCFSYPVEILPNLDGRVISLTKEIKVRNMQNVKLGKTLLEWLCKKGFSETKKIVVLNDTTSVLLSGMSVSGDPIFDDYLGLILGTGTNSCYKEANGNILKSKTLLNKAGGSLINLESGGYSGITRGVFDEMLDKTTLNPGEQKFEKMISGAYLGLLVSHALRKTAEDNLFSDLFSKSLKLMRNLTTREISDFLLNPNSDKTFLGRQLNIYGTEIDGVKCHYLVNDILERAAKLLAINMKAILVKADVGKNPCKPVCLTIDGSAFYGSLPFQRKFDFYMKLYVENYGYHVTRIQVENGTLIGSAMAALISKSKN